MFPLAAGVTEAAPISHFLSPQYPRLFSNFSLLPPMVSLWQANELFDLHGRLLVVSAAAPSACGTPRFVKV
jgi:hypothetical protein